MEQIDQLTEDTEDRPIEESTGSEDQEIEKE